MKVFLPTTISSSMYFQVHLRDSWVGNLKFFISLESSKLILTNSDEISCMLSSSYAAARLSRRGDLLRRLGCAFLIPPILVLVSICRVIVFCVCPSSGLGGEEIFGTAPSWRLSVGGILRSKVPAPLKIWGAKCTSWAAWLRLSTKVSKWFLIGFLPKYFIPSIHVRTLLHRFSTCSNSSMLPIF